VSARPSASAAGEPQRSAASLFDLLWESLADVLGTAAAATILRLALKRVAANGAGPAPEVLIERKDLEYHYRVPESWRFPGDEAPLQALRALGRELGTLLVELTGPVVVRGLERIDPFHDHHIHFRKDTGR
jgi:hypothetical protein